MSFKLVAVLLLVSVPASAEMLSTREKIRQLDRDTVLQQQIELQQLQLLRELEISPPKLPPTLVCEREYGDVLVCQAY